MFRCSAKKKQKQFRIELLVSRCGSLDALLNAYRFYLKQSVFTDEQRKRSFAAISISFACRQSQTHVPRIYLFIWAISFVKEGRKICFEIEIACIYLCFETLDFNASRITSKIFDADEFTCVAFCWFTNECTHWPIKHINKYLVGSFGIGLMHASTLYSPHSFSSKCTCSFVYTERFGLRLNARTPN